MYIYVIFDPNQVKKLQGNKVVQYFKILNSVYVVVKKLISILVTGYIQKRRGQALFFSFEYNLLPNLISNQNALHYCSRQGSTDGVLF